MCRFIQFVIASAALLLFGAIAAHTQVNGENEKKVLAAAPGRIEGSADALDVGASISGIVQKIAVKQGDTIAVGQVLVQIDCSDIAAQAEQRRAEYDAAIAEYRKLVNGPRPQEIDMAKADVELARARRVEAQARYFRSQNLVTRSIMSDADYQGALRDSQMTNAQLISAQVRLQLLEVGTREEDLAAGKAHMLAAQDTVAVTEAELAKCDIRSPINGIVLSKLVSVGELVSIYFPKPLLSIAPIDHYRVRAEVDEHDVALVHIGQEAEVIADAGQRLHGTVASLAPTMGRRKILTTDPADKSDRDVREVMIDLLPENMENIPIGLRVSVLFY
jgi:multidrug resistance efflux pump